MKSPYQQIAVIVDGPVVKARRCLQPFALDRRDTLDTLQPSRETSGGSEDACDASSCDGHGTFISGRATRSMDRFAIRIEGNELLVDLDRLSQADKQPAEWGTALVAVG